MNVDGTPKLIRAFLDYKQDRSQRLTHTIAVGDPSQLHYSYDLAAGNIACVWKGDFIDATPMWHDRGDGSYRPRGAVTYLSKESPITGTVNNSIKSLGYTLDAKGTPTFLYDNKGVKIKDKVYPDPEGKHLVREVSFINAPIENNLEFKLAEGQKIQKLTNTLYIIDQSYYIGLEAGTLVNVKNDSGLQSLVSPATSSIKYSIIW